MTNIEKRKGQGWEGRYMSRDLSKRKQQKAVTIQNVETCNHRLCLQERLYVIKWKNAKIVEREQVSVWVARDIKEASVGCLT